MAICQKFAKNCMKQLKKRWIANTCRASGKSTRLPVIRWMQRASGRYAKIWNELRLVDFSRILLPLSLWKHFGNWAGRSVSVNHVDTKSAMFLRPFEREAPEEPRALKFSLVMSG